MKHMQRCEYSVRGYVELFWGDFMEKKKFLIFGMISLVLCYIYASTLLLGKVLMPGIPELKRYDLLEEAEIEQQKQTGLDWLFWDSDSYIEYRFTPGREYLDIEMGGSGYRLMSAKLYFGIDGVYEKEYVKCPLRTQAHNACKIPKSAYNCVRIFPLGDAVEGLESLESNITSYLLIESISTANGVPGMLFLYGTTLAMWILFMGLVCIGVFFQNSFWFEQCFAHRYLLGTVLCFLLIFVLKTIYYPFNGISYFADAGFYYAGGDTFLKDGSFSLHNYLYTDPSKTMRFRGCMLPLLILVMKLPGILLGFSVELSYNICSAVFFAVFFAIALPEFFEMILQKKACLYQIVLSLLLFLLFLRGVIVYPLSDMYSAVFSIYAILGMMKMLRSEMKKGIFWGGMAGISLYLAYNIRAANLLLIILLLLILFVSERRSVKRLLCHISILMIAMILTSIPQIIVNVDICSKASPFVQVGEYGERSLIVSQLLEGLGINRFESELSAGNEVGARIYKNPMGERLFQEYSSKVWSIKDFLQICLKHPLTVSVLWGLHLLVAMDMRFPDVVNTNLVSLNGITFYLNIVFWWWCLLYLLNSTGRVKENKNEWKKFVSKAMWILLAIIPSLAQLCGAFEGRFATTIYILLFAYVSYEFPNESLASYIKKKKYMCVVLFLALMVGFGMVWSIAYANPSTGYAMLLD